MPLPAALGGGAHFQVQDEGVEHELPASASTPNSSRGWISGSQSGFIYASFTGPVVVCSRSARLTICCTRTP